MSSLVLVSGGFDPLHVGHLRHLQAAAELGRVVVALNSDAWLARKKGYAFMSWVERHEILAGLKSVAYVTGMDDADGTACEAIQRVRPAIFAKGGDRGPGNTPEAELCARLGIAVRYGVGGSDKPQASSALVERQWGFYRVLHEQPGFKVKLLTVMPGRATSLQRHHHRAEHWIDPARDRYEFVQKGEVHQLQNAGTEPLHIVEVQSGERCEESDIERLEPEHVH